MGETPAKRTDKQNFVDFQETNNNLRSIIDSNRLPASSSYHEGMIYISFILEFLVSPFCIFYKYL